MPTTLIPNNEAILLRLNREDQIAALMELFPNESEVNEDMPLSLIPKYIRWAGGTLDVRLATYHAGENKLYFFTEAEWNNTLGQQGYTKIGIALRARRQFLIISPEIVVNPKFGAYGLTFSDIEQCGASNPFPFDFSSGHDNTYQIVTQSAGYTAQSITGAPAAEACWNWHKENEYEGADKGKLQWWMPSAAEMCLIAENATAISSAISIFFPSTGVTIGERGMFISDIPFNATHCFYMFENTARCGMYGRNGYGSVRAVSSSAYFLG